MAGNIINEADAPVCLRLKYKGIFDFDRLQTFLVKWMQDRKFEVNEKKHKHKYSCPHGFEIELVIEGERKIDDYFMYKVPIGLHLWDAFEVDAVKDGKPVKLWNARIEITLGFQVIGDYQGRWETNPYLEKLRDKVFHQYVRKKEIIVKHADPLYYKLLSLHTKIKELLEMETATYF